METPYDKAIELLLKELGEIRSRHTVVSYSSGSFRREWASPAGEKMYDTAAELLKDYTKKKLEYRIKQLPEREIKIWSKEEQVYKTAPFSEEWRNRMKDIFDSAIKEDEDAAWSKILREYYKLKADQEAAAWNRDDNGSSEKKLSVSMEGDTYKIAFPARPCDTMSFEEYQGKQPTEDAAPIKQHYGPTCKTWTEEELTDLFK